MSTLVKTNGYFPSNSFFDDFFTRDLFDLNHWVKGWNTSVDTIPAVNILESNDDFRVEMAAPGMNKEDFKIELDNDVLKISAEKEVTQEDYARKEFQYGSFSRTFHLPNTVAIDDIAARYDNGVLQLVIPKKEEAKKKPVRTIAIS